MCVIAYKPINTAFMPKSVLKECFKNNPDGAGFMFSADGKVHIHKGYMNFTSFWEALSEARVMYGDNVPYVMHFRISTQAGVNQQCCHPYPLSGVMDNLKKLSCSANVGIAHNGVINLTSDGAKDYNDTMKFITDYVTLLIKKVDWWKNPNIAKALEKLCGSKLAILGNDNHVELIGNFIKDKGCYYSNSSYEEPKYTFGSYNTFKNSTIFFDEYADFYDKRRKKYDFTETYCPLMMDCDDTYCDKCSHCKKCSLLKEWLQDYDYDELLKVPC